jgi:thioesterase-3
MPGVNMTINAESGGMSSAPSVTEITIRGFHVDVFGVVNHAWYLHFFEEARWVYMDERAALRDGLHSAGIGHSVVSLVVQYRHPVRLGDILRIETWACRASSHSVTFAQMAYIGAGSDVVVEAQVTNVFFRTRGGQVVGVDNEVFDSWGEMRDLTKSRSGDPRSPPKPRDGGF